MNRSDVASVTLGAKQTVNWRYRSSSNAWLVWCCIWLQSSVWKRFSFPHYTQFWMFIFHPRLRWSGLFTINCQINALDLKKTVDLALCLQLPVKKKHWVLLKCLVGPSTWLKKRGETNTTRTRFPLWHHKRLITRTDFFSNTQRNLSSGCAFLISGGFNDGLETLIIVWKHCRRFAWYGTFNF